MERLPVREADRDGRLVAVSILGPTTCVVDGRSLELRRRERQVLAALVLLGPGEVSGDLLSDLVWPDGAPASADSSLRNHLARLRAAAGFDVVETTANGYRLGWFVASDAREVRSAGDDDFSTLEDTLARFRGRPFDELGDHPAAASARAAIEDARLQVEDDLAASYLGGGRPREALDLLVRLVAAEPFRERRWELMAEAKFATAGRRAALVVISDARSALAEAGLDIGPSLRDLERRALSDGLGDFTAPRTDNVPLFVGRDAEMETIWSHLDASFRSGRGGQCLVYGIAGIGKSALTERSVRDAERRGIRAIRLSGDPQPATPLAAWIAALEQLAGSGPARDLDEALQRAGVAGWGEGSAPPRSQSQLVAALVQAFGRACRQSRLLLIFDDLQLAPPTTASLLRKIARAGIAMDLLVTVRAVDEEQARDLAGLGEELPAIGLRPFGAEEVECFLRERGLTDLASGLVEVVVRRTGGNPLLVGEAAAAIARGGSDWSDVLAEGMFAQEAGRVFLGRLGRLSDGARRLLRAAAVFGPTIVSDELLEVAGRRSGPLTEALESGLITPGPAPGTIRFAHQLVHEAIEADLTEGERLEMHEAAAEAVRGPDAAGLTRIAFHHLALAEVDPSRAVRSAERAAVAHSDAFAHQDAAALLAQAITVAESAGLDPAWRCRLAVARGNALRLAGDPGCVGILLDAVKLADRIGDGDLVALATLAMIQLGPTTEAGFTNSVVAEWTDRALAVATDIGIKAQVAAAASLLHSMAVDPTEFISLYELGESLARQSGDDTVLAGVLVHAHLALGHPRWLDRRAGLAEELFGLAERFGRPDVRYDAACLRFTVEIQRGDPAIDLTVAQMRALTGILSDPTARWETAYIEAAVAHLHGRLAEAELMIDATLSFSGAVAPSRVRAARAAQILAIRADQGRLPELEETLATAATNEPGIPAWRAAWLRAAAEAGHIDDVERGLAAFRSGQVSFGVDAGYSFGLAATSVGRAAAVAGDQEVAEQIYERLSPFAGTFAWTGGATMGPVDTTLGILAAALRRKDMAVAHLRAAVDQSARASAAVYEKEARRLIDELG